MSDQATETKTEDLQGNSILTTKESPPLDPAAKLFQSEGNKTNAVAAAKEAVLKELETKSVADKTEPDKTAEKKEAATETKAPTEKVSDEALKAQTTSQKDYTLNLPENSALTKEDLDVTLKEAKAAGLSEDEAKEMLQSKDQVARAAQTRLKDKQQQDLKSMVTEWKESVKKDPELGGENLPQTAIKASRAFKAVASPALQMFCEQTGYADHPEMVRMMLRVYDLIGEDKFVRGSTGTGNSAPTTMDEKARKLFGNPIKEAAV